MESSVSDFSGWSNEFRAGTVSGLGLGLIFGYSLAEEQNQNPPSWLVMLRDFGDSSLITTCSKGMSHTNPEA